MAKGILSTVQGMFGRGDKRPTVTPMKEQGSSGKTVVGGWIMDRERNPKLTYHQRNTTYEEILANTAVAGASVRYFTALASTAVWTVKEAEKDKDRKFAAHVEKMMEKATNPWAAVVRHALMAKFFGFSVQEWTAFRDPIDGVIYYRSIENRPQRTIERFDIDAQGSVLGFGQRDQISNQELYIPRAKTFYMLDDLLTDSPAGMGVLRHIAETADRLTNYHDLEKQGFEKDLRNIPIGRIPYTELAMAVENGEIDQAFADKQIKAMEDIVTMSRKQSTSGLLIDSKPYMSKSDTAINVSTTPQWDITTLGGERAGNAPGLSDIAKAIERLQVEIARVSGTESLMLAGGGSQALSQDKSKNLYLMVNAALSDVKFQATKDLIEPMWRLNGFPEEMMPRFEVEDVNAKDAEAVAKVLRDMATAGATIAPNDEVINDVRDMLGVSKADLEAAAKLMEDERQKEDERFGMEADQVAANVKATEAKANPPAR